MANPAPMAFAPSAPIELNPRLHEWKDRRRRWPVATPPTEIFYSRVSILYPVLHYNPYRRFFSHKLQFMPAKFSVNASFVQKIFENPFEKAGKKNRSYQSGS